MHGYTTWSTGSEVVMMTFFLVISILYSYLGTVKCGIEGGV